MTDDRCKNCKYSSWLGMYEEREHARACLYILYRGKRRPCKAGEECTEFEPKEKRSWVTY